MLKLQTDVLRCDSILRFHLALLAKHRAGPQSVRNTPFPRVNAMEYRL
jgi:hypothetical protein